MNDKKEGKRIGRGKETETEEGRKKGNQQARDREKEESAGQGLARVQFRAHALARIPTISFRVIGSCFVI